LSLWMKSYGVTIQMKATEHYFPMVLFIILYKVVITFKSVNEIQRSEFGMKVGKWYFPLVLLLMLCKGVVSFNSIDKVFNVLPFK